MGGLEVSPERANRTRKARRRQEQRWAAKAGPVEVSFMEPANDTTAEEPDLPVVMPAEGAVNRVVPLTLTHEPPETGPRD